MKTMKKIFALALALMLVFSLALTANADAMTATGTVKITNAAAGETYEFYRVYDLESIKVVGEKVHPVYITNTKWKDFDASDYVTITNGQVIGLNDFDTDEAQNFAADVVDAGIAVDATATADASGTLEVKDLKYGYYVMKSNRTNENPKYTVFTLSSTPFEIEEKNDSDLPKFDKTVQEDSTVTEQNPAGTFGKTNDADIGQTVTFKLTVTAAAGTDAYSITDTMTNLEFIEIKSVKLISGTKTTDVATTDYTAVPNDTMNKLTITFVDDFRKTLKDGDMVEITYTAKLTKDAVIAGAGNPNAATLTYDENKSITANTTTKTYKLTVTKTDDKTPATKLEGATFVLKKGDLFYKHDETTGAVTWVDTKEEATSQTSDANGVLVFKGIDADNYTLVEIDAPDGYVLPAAGQDVAVDGNKENAVSVTNTLGEKLPETGGMGTTLFYTVGGLMVAAAVVLLVSKKRMGAM